VGFFGVFGDLAMLETPLYMERFASALAIRTPRNDCGVAKHEADRVIAERTGVRLALAA